MTGRELPDPPELGSLWNYSGWNNPDYTGPWRVWALFKHEPDSEVVQDRRIVLERVEPDRNGEHKRTDADLAFWPGGWRRDLLAERIAWEKANPRPEQLVRAERTVVQALNANGFGRQYQVTRQDGFEIAVDDLVVKVEYRPDG